MENTLANSLRQIKINCPQCGEFLFRVFKEVYDITKHGSEVTEGDPVCKVCQKKDFFEMLKSAPKIILLTKDEEIERKFKSSFSEGDKVVNLLGRKQPQPEDDISA